jgi:hypothetical protein
MKFTRQHLLASALVISLGLSLHMAWRDYSGDDASLPSLPRQTRAQALRAGLGNKAPANAAAAPDLARDPIVEAEADPFKVVSFLPPPPVVAAPVAPPPVVEAKPVAPPLPYRYFGRMTTTEGQTLTFLSRDEALVPVKVAAVLDGTYRVDAISDKQVLLTYLPLNEQMVVQAQSAAQ